MALIQFFLKKLAHLGRYYRMEKAFFCALAILLLTYSSLLAKAEEPASILTGTEAPYADPKAVEESYDPEGEVIGPDAEASAEKTCDKSAKPSFAWVKVMRLVTHKNDHRVLSGNIIPELIGSDGQARSFVGVDAEYDSWDLKRDKESNYDSETLYLPLSQSECGQSRVRLRISDSHPISKNKILLEVPIKIKREGKSDTMSINSNGVEVDLKILRASAENLSPEALKIKDKNLSLSDDYRRLSKMIYETDISHYSEVASQSDATNEVAKNQKKLVTLKNEILRYKDTPIYPKLRNLFNAKVTAVSNATVKKTDWIDRDFVAVPGAAGYLLP